MTTRLLPYITHETQPHPTASIIWLHGLGADGHDFEPIIPQLALPSDLAVRFVFPHAPPMPVSINGGYIMPAWYDIKQQDLGVEHDRQGIHDSALAINMLIEQELMRGIPSHRIILVGFSQGAAMSLYVGLRQEKALGGIMALSGYMLLEDEESHINPCTCSTPIFLAHGIQDPVVPFALGISAKTQLLAKGYHVDWHEYPMEHSVCSDEIADMGAWLREHLRFKES
jgi:phospholipase/carboxylesterase